MTNLDKMINSIRKWIDNITYGDMEDIAKDKKKLQLLDDLHKELTSNLNDIDCLAKKRRNLTNDKI